MKNTEKVSRTFNNGKTAEISLDDFKNCVKVEETRFRWGKSHIYGYCVYDTQAGHNPAYTACCELLPPISSDENGTICESPVLLENEYQAARLCGRLNTAWRKQLKKVGANNE